MAPIYVASGQVVVPGELVAEGHYEVSGPHVVVGRRVYAKALSVAVVEKPKRVRLIPIKQRYIPAEGDLVIGRVIEVGPTYWLVDINSPYTAILQASEALPRLQQASRDLSEVFQVGDLVAARVLSFDFTHDPLLTVRDPKLGKVSRGLLVEVPPSRVSRVIGRRGQVANLIQEALKVELLVGRNGRIMVVGREPDGEVAAAYVIQRLCAQPYVEDPLEEARKLISQAAGGAR